MTDSVGASKGLTSPVLTIPKTEPFGMSRAGVYLIAAGDCSFAHMQGRAPWLDRNFHPVPPRRAIVRRLFRPPRAVGMALARNPADSDG